MESEELTIVEEEVVEPPKEPKVEEVFDENGYIEKLLMFVERQDEESKNELTEFLKKTWTQKSDTKFMTEAYQLDNGSKIGQQGGIQKRTIGGLQRIVAPPSLQRKPLDLETMKLSSAVVPPLPTKKLKKAIPVIDDSISSSSTQPCKICAGVSIAGNTVLQCSACPDAYHMKCNKPEITQEDTEDARFIFLCQTCSNPKVALSKPSSRSSSPKVRPVVEMEKRKEKKSFGDSFDEFKKKKQINK